MGALITAALGGLSLLTPSGADAASRTIRFDAYRPLDGDRFVNVLFTYDDAVSVNPPSLTPTPPPPPGGAYGTPCSPAASPPFSPGDCYLNNTGNVLSPWSGMKSFSGYPITGVSGEYWEKETNLMDPMFNGYKIYKITGLAQVGSYEGGITPPPAIAHYISDNLINPTLLESLARGGSFSEGGILLLTDNPAYSYHLFTNPADNILAGCGSGTCTVVAPKPSIAISFSVDSNPAEGLLQPDPRHLSPNDVFALGMAPGGNGYPTEGEIFQSSGKNLGNAPDQTNVDRMSSSLGISAAPGGAPPFFGPFAPNAGSGMPTPPPPGGPTGTFGLKPHDNIISLSYGKDSGEVLQFSVDADAVGLSGTDVYNQSTLIPNKTPATPYPTNPKISDGIAPIVYGGEAAGDIYFSGKFEKFGSYRPDHVASGSVLGPAFKLNDLYIDESELGLQAPATAGGALGAPEDDLDALEEADAGDIFWGVDYVGGASGGVDGIPDSPVFFSLGVGSPSIGQSTVKAGGTIPVFTTANDLEVSVDDLLVSGIRPLGSAFTFGVYASGVLDIGLLPGDILDALVLSDIGGVGTGVSGNTPNGTLDRLMDEALFSLRRGSPTLVTNGYSPADVFYTNFNQSYRLYATSQALGLLATDELDALDIKPTPGPLPLFGVGGFFTFSRKLRHRIKAIAT